MTARVLWSYLGLEVAVLTVAALAVHLGPLMPLAHHLYERSSVPVDVQPFALIAHNLPIALSPLLLILTRWHLTPRARRAGDILVSSLLVYQALALGLGVGAWPDLLSRTPHLPLELTAAAAGSTAWWAASRFNPWRVTAGLALIATGLLVAAAPMETLSAHV